MSSGILKKNQKFLWVRCLAGFSGSVAQLRFACLPLAARAARRGDYFRQDKWDICDIRDGWDADEAQSDVCFSVPIRTHIQESVGCRTGRTDRTDRTDRTGRTGRTEACVQRTATDNNNRLYRSVSRSARGRRHAQREPPFLDRAFQLRCRLLKANIQAARVSESRPRNGCYAP